MADRARAVRALRRLSGSPWARAFVSAGLLAFVLSRIHLGRADERLSHGHPGLFAAAVGVVLAALVLAAARWHGFLHASGVELTRGEAVSAYLIGALATNILPSQVGGDVTRALLAGRAGSRARALATVIVDRATLLGCLLLLGWAVYATNPAPVPGSLAGALGMASALFSLGVLAGAAVVLRGGAIGSRLPNRLLGAGREMRDAFRSCLTPSLLAATTVLGLAYQALILLGVWLLARAIDVHAPLSVLATTVPPVLILTTLPISIGGFGVREGAFVVLLGRAGVPTTDATLLSLLTATAYALATLPAVGLLLRESRERSSRDA